MVTIKKALDKGCIMVIASMHFSMNHFLMVTIVDIHMLIL